VSFSVVFILFSKLRNEKFHEFISENEIHNTNSNNKFLTYLCGVHILYVCLFKYERELLWSLCFVLFSCSVKNVKQLCNLNRFIYLMMC